jgi:tape measure domain-containing protein
MLNEVKIKYVVDSSELAKATEAFDKLTAEEKAANAALDKFQENLNQTGKDAGAGLGSATNGAIKFGAAIGKSQSQVRAFTNSLKEAGAVAVSAGNKAAAGFSGVEAQLRKNQAAAAAFQRQLGTIKMPSMAAAGGGRGDLLEQLTSMVKLGGKLFIAKQIYDTTISMARMGAQVESLNAQFTFLTGSSQKAEQQIESLKSLANNFGVSFKTASESYKDFATAAILAGQSLDQTNQQFKAVVVASRAMGLSSEQMDGAFRALQQSLSKGVLQAEELRGQLSERIPGAFALTAQAVGVTEAELGKMISSGNVMAKDVLPLLAMQLEQTFGPQMVQMSDSLGSSMERFFNKIQNNAKTTSGVISPILKYMFDSLNYWDDLAGDLFDKVNLSSQAYSDKQKERIKENIRFNSEMEISERQILIAKQRGIKAEEVSRADASRSILRDITASYDALKNAAETYSKGDPRVQQELEYATIKRNILMTEVKREKEAVALRQKIQDDAAKGNADKAAKAAKAKAEAAERQRLAQVKKDFDAEMTRIEEQKKVAQIELEASKKDEATKAVELLRIEEKYLQDSIALREKYAKKEPKLAADFTKGKAVEQAQLGAVQQAIPTAGVDIQIKQLGKLAKAEAEVVDERYKNELKGAESRKAIRDSEIKSTKDKEEKKRRLLIENEIASNNEIIAINEKFMYEGNEDAMNAVDTQNAELIAKNKELGAELVAIDKEVAAKRAEIAAQVVAHIASITDGAFNLYQQNLSAELESSQKRYDEEVRLADGNKQRLIEIEAKKNEREREIRKKQFEAQRLQAVANVVFNTAPLIAQYLAGVLTAPLAAIAIAAQAAQIGFIMAQPVPEYRKGTRGKPHKGGAAIVGEEGVERVITESGKVYYTPPTATLVDLPKGAQVIPNHELKRELFYASAMNRNYSAPSVDPVASGINELGGILKSLPIHQINMDERGFEKYIRTPRRTTKLLNNRFGINN